MLSAAFGFSWAFGGDDEFARWPRLADAVGFSSVGGLGVAQFPLISVSSSPSRVGAFDLSVSFRAKFS